MKHISLKYLSLLGYLLLAGIFFSCASRQPLIIQPHPELPEESLVRRIKENPPDIKKYFILGENGNIIVKADITETNEDYEVIYELRYIRAEEGGGYTVPFSVTSLESGRSRVDKLAWKPEKDDTGLLLTFDDAFQEVWESNFGLFDRYNAKVTFFIQGSVCSFCIKALERGHDIGFHTMNHLNLPKVPREVFDEETLSEVEAFRNAGVPLDSFAYPFGLSEPWMHEELLKTYKILRGYGVTFRLYDSEAIRKGFIISKAIDTILFKTEEEFDAIIRLMFSTVKFIGGDLVLPLTTHDISDTASWGIKPRRLEYLLKTANDMKLNFYRFKDFLGKGSLSD